MRDFYVDLYSNSSLDIHPGNKNNSFRCHFPSAIYIQPNFECAAVEISYCPPIMTIDYVGRVDIFDFLHENPSDPVTYGQYYQADIPSGFYPNSDSFAEEINKQIWSKCSRLSGKKLIKYCKKSQKFVVDVPDELFCTLFIYSRLLYAIGATDKKEPGSDIYVEFGHDKQLLTYDYKGQKRKFYDDVNKWETGRHGNNSFEHLSQVGVVDTMVIYCSTIEPVLSPNGSFQILRTCALRQDQEARVDVRFDVPHYFNVSQNFFEDISVEILSIWREPIEFISGFFRLKLHFRPRSLF